MSYRRNLYRRLSRRTRCDCGRRATCLVWFPQLTPTDEPVLASLPVCEACARQMLADDPAAALTPDDIIARTEQAAA